MKNNECIIYAKSKTKIVQTIYKTKKGWMQKSAKGNFYPMTAEQVLSHILPPLAGKSKAILEVKAKRK
ncbi:MAG: hypothetical protein Q7R52_01690 [archaeon]|nr:hypothetical protein [archaeon]